MKMGDLAIKEEGEHEDFTGKKGGFSLAVGRAGE